MNAIKTKYCDNENNDVVFTYKVACDEDLIAKLGMIDYAIKTLFPQISDIEQSHITLDPKLYKHFENLQSQLMTSNSTTEHKKLKRKNSSSLENVVKKFKNWYVSCKYSTSHSFYKWIAPPKDDVQMELYTGCKMPKCPAKNWWIHCQTVDLKDNHKYTKIDDV